MNDVQILMRILASMTPLEMVGGFLGLMGTGLLAVKSRWSGWGFVAYLGSNVAWIWFSLIHGHGGLLLQQAGFTVFALVGIWQWLVAPYFEALNDALNWETEQ